MTPLETTWQRKWLNMDATSPGVQQMATAAQSYAVRFAAKGPKRLLVVSGATGAGKTHLARSLYHWAQSVAITLWTEGKWQAPPIADFIEWSNLVKLDAREWRDFLFDTDRTNLLVVDDIGSEVDQYKSGEPIERLRLLLSRREDKWTVVTTNVSPLVWQKTWDARVADRLMRNSQIIVTSAESYALVSRKAA